MKLVSFKNNKTTIILFIVFLIFNISCKEESIPPTESDETFSSSTVSVTPEAGGLLELLNSNGDIIQLSIPQNAVSEPVIITLQILNNTQSNPFSHNLINTIRILPDGFRLDSAATLKVTFNSVITDTNFTILYYRKQEDLAYPLQGLWENNKTLTGSIYHFSDYGGASPSSEEIVSQSQKAKNTSNIDVWNWQGFYDYIGGLLKYYNMLIMLGESEKAEELSQEINKIIEKQINTFLDLPVPDEPCGFYLRTLLKYAFMFFKLGDNEVLNDRVQTRLNQVLNSCYLRGELQFSYHYCVSAADGDICRDITGFVPFIVNTLVGTYGQVEGSGALEWTGNMSYGDCTYNEEGVVNITLGGQLDLDDQGVPWFNFEILESASGLVNVVCAGIQYSYPFSPDEVSHQIRLLAENGSTLQMPVEGASSGYYEWILHMVEH
jgi:hypothetical protein